MAKQSKSESRDALAAEMALLRHRLARLEDTVHQMIQADAQVSPPAAEAPREAEAASAPGRDDEAARPAESPASVAAISDTQPLTAPAPLGPQPAETPEAVEPAESEAQVEPAEPPVPAGPASPSAAPAPVEPARPAAKATTPPTGAQTLEQTIGMRWMLFVGVGVLLLAAVFFFMYAIEQGWIGPHRRVLIGAIVGLAMLGAGEWAFRRGMRLYAGAIGGAGIALLYLVVFVASPNGLYAEYNMLGESATGAFALMCLVTLMGVAAALRSNIQPTAIISLLGALATPALLSSGQDRQIVLMTYLLIVDAGFLAIAWKKAWRALLPIAMAGTGLLFMLWFASHYPSEGLGWSVTSMFGWAFFAMFVTFGSRGAAQGRVSPRGAVAITGISAGAMVLLWLAQNLGTALASQLLVVSVIVLALCVWQQWRKLAQVAMVVAGAVFMLRFGHVGLGRALGQFATCAFAWAFFVLFAGYGAIGSLLDWISRKGAIITTTAAGGAMTLLWLAHDLHGALAGQLLVLNTIVLASCMRREWHMLRIAPLAWTVIAMAVEWSRVAVGNSPMGAVAWSVWAWALFALATADVVLRIGRPNLRKTRWLDPAIATAAMAAMFAGTYRLLDIDHHALMGLYTALLGAAAITAGWLVTVRARWRELGYAYFGQGLVLLALAVPIQFDQSMVTIAWAVQGVVAMLLARRLGSRTLVFKSVVLFALAVGHFLSVALRQDPRLAEIAMSVGGVDVSLGLLLATGLTAGILAAVALLRAGKAVWDEQGERTLACTMVVTAAVFFFARTLIELPHLAATWWCMSLSAGLAAWGLVRRSTWLTLAGGAAVGFCVLKWLFNDTLSVRVDHGAIVDAMVVMNWQFWTGLVLSAIALACARAFQRQGIEVAFPNGLQLGRVLDQVCAALVCIIVVWGGSFEIDRFFAASSSDAWANPAQARHMAFSLWWALWAVAVLVIGFVASRPALRYLALGVFAITLGKVFLVDMQQVRTVYRILSFLGLGVTLLGGALLYNRRFTAARASEGEQDSSATGENSL